MTAIDTQKTKPFPYDHVVVVVLENHSFDEIVGSPYAPYINETLVKGGVLINNAYGEQHPSQPNYFWLFSGSNQGIIDDSPYWPQHQPGPVFNAPNLYTALEETFGDQTSNFFVGYVDSGTDKPVTNYYCDTHNYANRHVPWLGFTNIHQGKPAEITKDFTEFPHEDFQKLPLVSFVIPALNHDMHDYDSKGNSVKNTETSNIAIELGDTWLHSNLDAYAQWAKENNSLLIITFDEDSSADWVLPVQYGGDGTQRNPMGMTAPNLWFNPNKDGETTSGPNQIMMLFYGANLKYTGPVTVPGTGVNNINLLRTIEQFYDLPKSGSQTQLSTAAGMSDGPIEGIFNFES